jgi:hypothetical protein
VFIVRTVLPELFWPDYSHDIADNYGVTIIPHPIFELNPHINRPLNLDWLKTA